MQKSLGVRALVGPWRRRFLNSSPPPTAGAGRLSSTSDLASSGFRSTRRGTFLVLSRNHPIVISGSDLVRRRHPTGGGAGKTVARFAVTRRPARSQIRVGRQPATPAVGGDDEFRNCPLPA